MRKRKEGYKAPPEKSRRPKKPTPPPPDKIIKVKPGEMMLNFYTQGSHYDDEKEGCKKILLSLVEEISARKPKITARFITKHTKIFMNLAETNAPKKIYQDFVAGLIKEVEDKMSLKGGLNDTQKNERLD